MVRFGTKWPSITSTCRQIGAAALDRGDRVGQAREVGGEDGRGDPHAHRLTSSEIVSPGAIWKPACGDCRRTTPGGTPG